MCLLWSKKISLLFPLLLLVQVNFAQDSLENLTEKSFEDLDKLCNFYITQKEEKRAQKIAKLYLSKAKKHNDTFNIVQGYRLYTYTTKNEKKISYFDSIIELTKHKNVEQFPANGYYLKAQYLFYTKRNVEEAIKNVKLAREYAIKSNNLDLIYRLDYLIGVVKSEHLGEKQEAIEIFKNCISYYEQNLDRKHLFRYIYNVHILAETYIGLHQQDSSTFYNTLGYKKTMNGPNSLVNKMSGMFQITEGINHYYRNNYEIAIDSIRKGLPLMHDINEVSSIVNGYYYLGQAYFQQKELDSAVFYFHKTDSILDTQSSIPQYKHVKTYEYLKNYYRRQDNLEQSNAYLSKLNKVLKHYMDDKIYISTKVKQDYDVPVLIDEQKGLIKALDQKKNIKSYGLIVLSILVVGAGVLGYYQYQKKKKYYKRFKTLMKEKEEDDKKAIETPKDKNISKKQKDLDVPEKHVLFILEELEKFENERKYLEQGLGIKELASQMNTNVRYVSKVINFHKNKTFINYLNELRITYAIEELKTNITLRKYTIKAIAEEMGYNSSETFSTAFFKQTGIKPSFFISQLKKQEKT